MYKSFLISLAIACAQSPNVQVEPNPPAIDGAENPSVEINPVETTGSPQPSDGFSTPPEAITSCIQECMESQQMRAVAIQLIEADCRATCTGEPDPMGTQPVVPTLQ